MKKPLDKSPSRRESKREPGGTEGGTPPDFLGPDMRAWSDRQVQAALYSQLFLIGLSLREAVRTLTQLWRLVSASNWNVNVPTPQSPPDGEERVNKQPTKPTQRSNDPYQEWLRFHDEVDEAVYGKPGIDEGREPPK